MGKSLKKPVFILAWILVIPAFVASQLSFWNFSVRAAEDAAAPTEQNKEVIEEKKDSISDLEKELKKELAEKAKLEQNLGQIQNSVVSTQREINKAQALIKETEENVARKQAEIKALEEQNDLQKDLLRKIVKELYYAKKAAGINVVFAEGDFSDVLSSSDHLITLEEKVRSVAQEILDSKQKIAEEKNQLADTVDDHEDLLAMKAEQKQELLSDKAEVASDVAEKEATIGELQGKLDDLRSDLSSLLGKSLSADDIVEAAKIAGKSTGVRKDFILGELFVETDLGRFTGGCTYKNIRMKPADKAQFLKIAEELEDAYGGNYKNKKLSCSPGFGYGGAMGVAQFMPTTWIGYEDKIAAKTGHNPPDPWNLIDGVMGMAIKLAAGGATSKSGEKMASKRYYCGGPASPYWNTKCEDYARKVQYWADNYEKKL